jgi:hypothetical protein
MATLARVWSQAGRSILVYSIDIYREDIIFSGAWGWLTPIVDGKDISLKEMH